MKNIKVLCGVLFLAVHFDAFSQTREDVEQLLLAGAADLNTYAHSYLEPAGKGFIYSMAPGWAQTADTHSLFGFHLKASVSAAAVPSTYETFTFVTEDYQNLYYSGGGNNAELPTLFGPSDDHEWLQVQDENLSITGIPAPPGAGLAYNYVPVPSIQAGLGLPAGTEVMFRFIPKTSRDKIKFSQLGIGIKHNLKQYIPGIKNLPFHFSGLIAYNSLHVAYYLDQGENQYSNLQARTWTFQAMASKKMAFLTLYGGLGYHSGNADFKVMGTYPLKFAQSTGNITHPVNLTYREGGAMANLGARLKFGPVFVNGDYTIQEFNVLTLGLGISIL